MNAPTLIAFPGNMLAAFVALLLPVSSAVATASAAERFEARDLFALEIATDPQIAPDGDTVAYVRSPTT